jgi:hypothetical protein
VAERIASVRGKTDGNGKKWQLIRTTKTIKEIARKNGKSDIPITGESIGGDVRTIAKEIACCKNSETKNVVSEVLQKWTCQNHFHLLNKGLTTSFQNSVKVLQKWTR